MYDFFLGTREEIERDEHRYLVAIKRMLPRWVNSIPDSEFVAICELLDQEGKDAASDRRFVAVETGVGATTLACAYYAMKYDGLAFSWDLNSQKGSTIRAVCSETIANHFGEHVNEHWKLVAYNSLSPHLGLPILPELVDHVDVFLHDSDHVWETIRGEIEAVMPLLSDGGIIALDDANKDYAHTNTAYINTFRRKLGLDAIDDLDGNRTEPFHVEVERLLESHWEHVEHLRDSYKGAYREDPYFAYYDAEFDLNIRSGMERDESLEHRFDSWRVRGRK